MSDQKKEIVVNFRKSSDYKVYPATGAWGGPTPDGSILMNLMIEHGTLPSYQKFDVDNSGGVNLQNPTDVVASGDMEREILCGLVVSPRTAKNIAAWLNMHADNLLGGQH